MLTTPFYDVLIFEVLIAIFKTMQSLIQFKFEMTKPPKFCIKAASKG